MAADTESAARFHQLAGAATAKGIEDRLFYRLTRLVSLQEVGGAPDRFGVTPAEFHTAAAERAHRWPGAMTRSEEHTSELQSRGHLVCRLLLEKKKATLNRTET